MDRLNIHKEIKLKGIKSSGPGGQNVNKVSSKIELTFNLDSSKSLTEVEKEKLKTTLKKRLTKENTLILHCDENRSQLKNKSIVLKRFQALISEGLKSPKRRKSSRPTRNSILKRLDNKKHHGEKKANRKRPNTE